MPLRYLAVEEIRLAPWQVLIQYCMPWAHSQNLSFFGPRLWVHHGHVHHDDIFIKRDTLQKVSRMIRTSIMPIDSVLHLSNPCVKQMTSVKMITSQQFQDSILAVSDVSINSPKAQLQPLATLLYEVSAGLYLHCADIAVNVLSCHSQEHIIIQALAQRLSSCQLGTKQRLPSSCYQPFSLLHESHRGQASMPA